MTTSRSRPAFVTSALTIALGAVLLVGTALPAAAADAPVGLGTATSYAVLAGSTITNTGPSVINGDLGVSPGTAVTGFPPGSVAGTIHQADAAALQAKNDLRLAYNDASGRGPATAVATELGGRTLLPGVYVGGTLQVTGTVTLDAGGDPDAVFVLQSNSTLVTAADSAVSLIGEANPCNVYWLVRSSATLGVRTAFTGTVLALTSITATTGASVEGRLLARNGAVTLDTNVITLPSCAAIPPAPGTGSPATRPEAPTSVATTAPSLVTTAVVPTTAPTTTSTGPTPTTDTTPTTGPGGPGSPGTPGGPGQPVPPSTIVTTPPRPGSPPVTASPPLPRTGVAPDHAATGAALVVLGLGMLLAARRRVRLATAGR